MRVDPNGGRTMYQPALNRFASRDPLSADGVDVIPNTGWFGERLDAMRHRYGAGPAGDGNLYLYVSNRPTGFVDPSGLQAPIDTERPGVGKMVPPTPAGYFAPDITVVTSGT